MLILAVLWWRPSIIALISVTEVGVSLIHPPTYSQNFLHRQYLTIQTTKNA